MSFPKTKNEFAEQGYVFDSVGRCAGADCGKEIHWYITPLDRRIPIDPPTLEPHFATCPNRKQFGRKAASA